MAHDITKDVIGVKEFEVQDINKSGEPVNFLGSISLSNHIVNKGYVDAEIVDKSWLKTTAQTGLTGDKTGTFNLTTTGVGTFGVGTKIIPDQAKDAKLEIKNWVRTGFPADTTNAILESTTDGQTVSIAVLAIRSGVRLVSIVGETQSFLIFENDAADNGARLRYDSSTDIISFEDGSSYDFDNDVNISKSIGNANLTVDGNANIGGTVTVNNLNGDDGGIILKAGGAGNPAATEHPGFIEMHHDSTGNSIGVIFKNVDSKFVWKISRPTFADDVGVAWVSMSDGRAEFAGMVINQAGGNGAINDFRVETANSTTALLIDASADTAKFSVPLDVVDNNLTVRRTDGTAAQIFFSSNTDKVSILNFQKEGSRRWLWRCNADSGADTGDFEIRRFNTSDVQIDTPMRLKGDTGDMVFENNLILPKTSGKGIKVDIATPTF